MLQPSKSFVNMLDDVVIYNDPYGVVLVISPWNYPLQLAYIPMTAALAAGNCVVLKPSEIAVATGKLLAELIPKYIDNVIINLLYVDVVLLNNILLFNVSIKDVVQVVCGGVEETKEILNQKFDYIFFTGSTNVGRIVHAAANKHLTPTTLELGGKRYLTS